MNKTLLALLGLCLFKVSSAQETTFQEKGEYVDSLNRYYIQTSKPLYIYLSTKANDSKPTAVSSSDSENSFNTVEPMYLDGDGKHTIQHFDTKCKKPVVFTVYADGISPVTTSSFTNSPKNIRNTISFFGKNLLIKLSATDDLSGVNQIFYSLNNEAFQPYNPNLQLNLKEGENTLKYYTIDNVGNTEKISEKKFTIDLTPPSTTYNITSIGNKKVIAKNSVMYLLSEDNISGVAQTFFKFDNEQENLYNGKNIAFQRLSEGDHTLICYSVDNVKNTEEAQSFNFFYDKTAPIVATDVLGDKFIVNDQIYFSGRTKLKITAIDNKIGVKETKYSIDNSEYIKYSEPFYLPSKPGIHLIRYYAIDSLDNLTIEDTENQSLEYKHTVSKVYVDLTGPTMEYAFLGEKFNTRDSIFINSNTQISMSCTDNESGKQKITYTLDNDPTEIDYKEPLKIDKAGIHHIQVIGYDNVNNRNYKTAVFVVDNIPPSIQSIFSVKEIGISDSLNIYPSYVQIFVAPSDNLTGISKILYSVNNQPEKVYSGNISGFNKNEKNIVIIKAYDNLGNVSEATLSFIVK